MMVVGPGVRQDWTHHKFGNDDRASRTMVSYMMWVLGNGTYYASGEYLADVFWCRKTQDAPWQFV